ncbi:MAG TPA: AAA family ATPase [Candidatus Saccharimonadales bacterium]|nr:AAA family ATPase [Candidatus Saccharimonadales bacterium]
MKIFITGSSGTGKTSVAKALSDKGYSAFSPEDMGINKYIDMKTNAFVPRPTPPIDHSRYRSTWDTAKLKKMLASDDVVFIAGQIGTQADYYNLFDKIIVLTAANETIKQRLLHRNTNPYDYGKHPDEMKHVMWYNLNLAKELLDAPGAIAIDASQPLDAVVAEVLRHSNEG